MSRGSLRFVRNKLLFKDTINYTYEFSPSKITVTLDSGMTISYHLQPGQTFNTSSEIEQYVKEQVENDILKSFGEKNTLGFSYLHWAIYQTYKPSFLREY